MEQIREGGISDCRNRSLQRMFLLLGIGETAGSGFSRILRAWREQSWRAPSLRIGVDPEMTTLELPTSSLLPDELVQPLSERFGPRFERLSPEERIAVVTAAGEGRITNERLREQTAIHPRDATLLLRKLVDETFLLKHGQRSDAWYSLDDGDETTSPSPGQQEMLSFSPEKSLWTLDQPLRSPHQSSQSSHQTSSNSSHQTSSNSSHQSSQSPEMTPVRLSRVASSKWARASDVRKAILALCSKEFQTVAEMAHVLNRSPLTIQRKYVSKLLSEGLLEQRYPKTPSHPRQAYRATPRKEPDA